MRERERGREGGRERGRERERERIFFFGAVAGVRIQRCVKDISHSGVWGGEEEKR